MLYWEGDLKYSNLCLPCWQSAKGPILPRHEQMLFSPFRNCESDPLALPQEGPRAPKDKALSPSTWAPGPSTSLEVALWGIPGIAVS